MHAHLRQTPRQTGQLYSNHTHYSPADPEARIVYKRGKPRLFTYRASVSVDATRTSSPTSTLT